jgi:hypothetical protein
MTYFEVTAHWGAMKISLKVEATGQAAAIQKFVDRLPGLGISYNALPERLDVVECDYPEGEYDTVYVPFAVDALQEHYGLYLCVVDRENTEINTGRTFTLEEWNRARKWLADDGEGMNEAEFVQYALKDFPNE